MFDVGHAFTYFADLLETLVICVNQEDAEYIVAKATYTQYGASGFEFHRSPVLYIGESCSSNTINDGADRAVRLFLLELCFEIIGAGIAIQAEWSRLVDNIVPIGKDMHQWS